MYTPQLNRYLNLIIIPLVLKRCVHLFHYFVVFAGPTSLLRMLRTDPIFLSLFGRIYQFLVFFLEALKFQTAFCRMFLWQFLYTYIGYPSFRQDRTRHFL